jgi:hypothetical protein
LMASGQAQQVRRAIVFQDEFFCRKKRHVFKIKVA